MSASTASLSVIVPCRNGRRWLREALQSVLDQTVRPAEIIVIDDGSTDGSAELAASFGSIVRVCPNQGRGSNAARRTGVSQSRGEFVALIDSDDLIEPTKHEKQLAVLESGDPYTIVHTGSTTFRTDDPAARRIRRDTELASGDCTQVIFERNPVCGASVMFRRSVILELGNYDPEMITSGDYLLWLVASTRCRFECIPEPLYHIRRHEGNLTNRFCLKTRYHWLAQEKFRRACPDAFAGLPAESIERYMREPVLRATRESYWLRLGDDYRALLQLAIRVAPDDADVRRLWRRRWVPMSVLRAWDMLRSRQARGCAEGRR